MEDDLIRRAEDLSARCARRGIVTNTQFLTPAECHAIEVWAKRGADCAVLLHGGYDGAERRVAFFLPDWMEPADFNPAEHICALEGVAAFGDFKAGAVRPPGPGSPVHALGAFLLRGREEGVALGKAGAGTRLAVDEERAESLFARRHPWHRRRPEAVGLLAPARDVPEARHHGLRAGSGLNDKARIRLAEAKCP